MQSEAQIEIEQKSIHACRRTVNSTLRCLSVSSTVDASMMGHTPEVNESHYTYDISGLDKKREVMKRVNMLMHAK